MPQLRQHILGEEVTAVCGTEQVALVKSLGAGRHKTEVAGSTSRYGIDRGAAGDR